jgi:hypothetical protein
MNVHHEVLHLILSPAQSHSGLGHNTATGLVHMRYWIAVALLLGSAQSAMADWQYTKWGMTPEQVASASHGAVKVIPKAQRKRVEEAKMENGAEGTFTDGELRLHVAFSFDTDGAGLNAVGYDVMDAAQNDLLKAWLVRTYGAPDNKGGLSMIGLTTWYWSKPDEIEMNISKGTAAFVMQSKKR